MSPEMHAAVTAFKTECPMGVSVRPQSNPLYTLIAVDGWPEKVHYEFRDNAESRELYVEFHIEDSRYVGIKEALRAIVTEVGEINGFKFNYFESRTWPNRKTRPSASIAVPKDPDGRIAAATMRSLIEATRGPLGFALHQYAAL